MKQIKSTISYTVPSWNFCNSDILTAAGDITSKTCRFCIKDKHGVHCVLYGKSLATKDDLIYKVRDCCRATAGFESVIDEAPPAPSIQPKELMKHTIDLYEKTLKELIDQGYPRQIATTVAKQHILGG